jgi:hypothetical protein
MAIESHLAELERKHQALKQEINETLTHPSADDLRVAELKRRKLYVKDEITRLRHEVVSVHWLSLAAAIKPRLPAQAGRW